MPKKQKNIIVYVMTYPRGAGDSIRKLKKQTGIKYETILLRDSRQKYPHGLEFYDGLDQIISCDFGNPSKIAETLMPLEDRLAAITCRADTHMARFRAIIPHVPYLRTPSTDSITWATDKFEMRKRFKLYAPKNTPRFSKVVKNSKAERQRIIEKVGFPMIVKPANLALSMLVDVCYHEEELEKVLRNNFRKIKKVYSDNTREEEPMLIAEEYMEGLMYSIDSYVTSRGSVHHCPMVRIKLGREIGHPDSFCNYLQTTPTALKKETIASAEAVVEQAIHALGLRSTTAHTELMKVDDEWKIVEVGARTGGFRHQLHELSCDIDHSLNDILIRLPKKPVIPKKCKGFATAMKWYAKKEGTVAKLKGIKKIESLDSFKEIHVHKRVGDKVKFARNGGKSVFDLFLYNKDRSRLLADIRRAEGMVEIKVANGSAHKTRGKKSKK